MKDEQEKAATRNQTMKIIEIELNDVLAGRLEKVAATRNKKLESIAREAISRYLKRFNRTFKLW